MGNTLTSIQKELKIIYAINNEILTIEMIQKELSLDNEGVLNMFLFLLKLFRKEPINDRPVLLFDVFKWNQNMVRFFENNIYEVYLEILYEIIKDKVF